MEIRYLLKTILLPPFTQIIVLLMAWPLHKRRPLCANALFILAVLSLWGLGTPIASTSLALSLRQDQALQPHQLATLQADAIVILSGTQNEATPEFGEPVSGEQALSRIRYGAFLQRRTGLPVLLSGGSVQSNEHRSLAETMAFDLFEGFGIQAKWLEAKSRTTAENADFSYEILEAENKTSILLVTSSLHMMRAKWSFERAGFFVQPAPTDFIDKKTLSTSSFIPNAHSLQLSSEAIHEWLGYWVYLLLN
ncbi:YdcF family protein [Desulforhopalus sp. IMCC35007]|uniref:YdcF family protein n=1 Tax=Desulforhopalus sp. IMCC35007 TaxID=2569543 RepID=UPI0010ADFBA8|nr:YdcF family protein [Desulforhopalus sp. IMCC35007]TKB08561.1 YdcF family protein [Desulforhopalus sp. IMCC35007]